MRIFGTDGIRGRANHYPMTVEVALAVGRAIGKTLFKREGRHRVVVGKDTRLSCYMYENALIAGLCSMGVDTLMVGPLPTPGVAFITRAYRADLGIVISASHNAYHDNGIKIFSAEGYKFSNAWEQEIEASVAAGDFVDRLPADSHVGRNTKIDDAAGRYIEFAKGTFPRRRSLAGLKIALDCANGASYYVAPMIFRELDAEVSAIGIKPNGLNINDECGALCLSGIRQQVIDNQADVGIALDGDADRVILIDENGEVVDGDTILAICARAMKEKGLLNGNKVVSTVMANLGFIKAMEELAVETILTSVGDRNVTLEMREQGANLGGEQSGHIIFSDYNTTGDGLVTALQVLTIMVETGARLSELATCVAKYPQVCLNVNVQAKVPLNDLPDVQAAIVKVKEKLGSGGRILVRYSGTEHLCRVMVEGEDKEQITRYAKEVYGVIKRVVGR